MILPTLHKKDKSQRIRTWTVEFAQGAYRTIWGVLGGKISTSAWTYTKNTNLGKINARGHIDQAEFEARAKWCGKKKAGYVEESTQ